MKLIQPDSCEIVTPKEIELIRFIRQMHTEDRDLLREFITRRAEKNMASCRNFHVVIRDVK